MTSNRSNTTIRLDPEERAELESLMKAFGYTQVSPFIRYAIAQLKRTAAK